MRQIPDYQLRHVRELRQRQTESEAVMWECLRDKRLSGAKFRRQRPLGRYIADFCCDSARLVIEIDGGIHSAADQQEYDKIRNDVLNAWGYTLIRIGVEEVTSDLPEVIARITAALPQP